MGFKREWYTWDPFGQSPICPTWDSRIGQTRDSSTLVHMGFHWTVQSIPHVTGGQDGHVGFQREWYTWDLIGQSHLSHMVQ